MACDSGANRGIDIPTSEMNAIRSWEIESDESALESANLIDGEVGTEALGRRYQRKLYPAYRYEGGKNKPLAAHYLSQAKHKNEQHSYHAFFRFCVIEIRARVSMYACFRYDEIWA